MKRENVCARKRLSRRSWPANELKFKRPSKRGEDPHSFCRNLTVLKKNNVVTSSNLYCVGVQSQVGISQGCFLLVCLFLFNSRFLGKKPSHFRKSPFFLGSRAEKDGKFQWMIEIWFSMEISRPVIYAFFKKVKLICLFLVAHQLGQMRKALRRRLPTCLWGFVQNAQDLWSKKGNRYPHNGTCLTFFGLWTKT